MNAMYLVCFCVVLGLSAADQHLPVQEKLTTSAAEPHQAKISLNSNVVSLNNLINKLVQGLFNKEKDQLQKLRDMQQNALNSLSRNNLQIKHGCVCNGLKCKCCIHQVDPQCTRRNKNRKSSWKTSERACENKQEEKVCLDMIYSDIGDNKLNMSVSRMVPAVDRTTIQTVLNRTLIMKNTMPDICIPDEAKNRLHCIQMHDLSVAKDSLSGCAHVVSSDTKPSQQSTPQTTAQTTTDTKTTDAVNAEAKSVHVGRVVRKFGCFNMVRGGFSSQSSMTILNNEVQSRSNRPMKVSLKIKNESPESNEWSNEWSSESDEWMMP